MDISGNILKELLQELDQWMEYNGCEAADLLVCGGAALHLQDLSSRPTQDVDILGRWDPATMNVSVIENFSQDLLTCIHEVANRHPDLAGLKHNWLNLGPQDLARRGLPTGFADRIKPVRIGGKLTLHLLGRQDLLALKLYAAADEFRPREAIHFADLKALKPSYDELDKAVQWIRTLPDFEQKRPSVKHVLERLGHEDLAYYV